MAEAENTASVGIEVDSEEAVKGLGEFSKATTESEQRLNKLETSLNKVDELLRGAFRDALTTVSIALGGIGFGDLLEDLIKTNNEYEKTRLALLAGANSALAAGDDFRFLTEQASRLGLPVQQVGIEFARLTASAKQTALQGQPVRDLFQSLSEAGVATGRSAQNMQRVFLAVSEMLSTVTVTAREARIQFGQQLPGGFKIMAEAWAQATHQVFNQETVNKFRKALAGGGVDAVGILMQLPKILKDRFGPAFDAALNESPQLAIGRFKVGIDNLMYTLGQSGGFMREFTGLLNDLVNIFASEKGQAGIKSLGDALGIFMGIVRQAVDFVAEHIRIFAGLFAGLVTATVIRTLESLVGWFFKLKEGVTILAALLSPWTLLASAIGVAVFLVAEFGTSLITLGSYTARLVDWIVAPFRVAGEELENLLKKIPGLAAAVNAFSESKRQGSTTDEALGNAVQAAKVQVEFSLGPDNMAKVMEFIHTVESSFNGAIERIKISFNHMISELSVAFNSITDVVDRVVQHIATAFNSAGGTGTFNGLLEAAGKVGTILLDTVLGSINAVVAGIEYFAQVFDIVFKAIEPIINPIASLFIQIVNTLAQLGGALLGLSVEPIKGLADGVQKIFIAFNLVASIVVGLVSVIAGALGPVVEAIGSAFSGVVDVVKGVFETIARSSQTTNNVFAQGTKQATNQATNGWIVFGDALVGILVTSLKDIGLVIEAIGVMANVLIQFAGRAGEVFKGLTDSTGGFLTKNVDLMKAGALELSNAFTPLQETGAGKLAADLQAALSPEEFQRNFHIVSSAVKSGKEMFEAGTQLGHNVVTGFQGGTAEALANNRDPTSAMFGANGSMAGQAWIDGFAQQVGQEAVRATQEAAAKQAASEAAAQARLKAQRDAWEAENAAVDRSDRSSEGKGKHKKAPVTFDQAANQQIAVMKNQIATDAEQLSLIQQQDVSYQHINQILAAQAALTKAGLRDKATHKLLTVEQALAEGGIAAKLANTAMAAELYKEQLQQARDTLKDIAKNLQGIDVAQDQVNLAKNLGISGNEYKAQQTANQQLRQRGFTLTYQEAIATEGLGNAQNKLAYNLAASAHNQVLWNQAAQTAEEIASTDRGIPQLMRELQAYTVASYQGVAALAAQDAEFAAQKAVMAKYHDDVFDSTRLQDLNTKSLYEFTRALTLAGGSGTAYAKTLKDIDDQYKALLDPVQAAIDKLNEQDAAQRQVIANGVTLAQQALAKAQQDYNNIGDNISSKGVDDAQAKLNAAIATAKKAGAQLDAITRSSVQHVSNDFGDAAAAAFSDFGHQATDFGTQTRKIFGETFDGMANALANFVVTGKLSFKSLAQSVIRDIALMIVKWLEWMAIKAALSFLGLPIPLASGGVVSSAGSAPLSRGYATGGVANSPQMALFGEGSKPEAFVPLPDGRTIPVTLKGSSVGSSARQVNQIMFDAVALGNALASGVQKGLVQAQRQTGGASAFGGGGHHIELHSHVQINNTGAGTGGGQGGSSVDSKTVEIISKRMHDEMKGLIIQTVIDQTRPGGQLNPRGANRDRF